MADVFGFDAEGIRKITEVVRRVMQAEFGKGGKRQRYPLPIPDSPSKLIKFRYEEAITDLIGHVTILASTDGRRLGETDSVHDATDEGCFFGDEAEYDLIGRTGYAVYVKAIVDESSGAQQWQWHVLSLCCPTGS